MDTATLDELQDSTTPENAENPVGEQPQEEKKTVPYNDFQKVYARAKKAEEELKQIKGKQQPTSSDDDLEDVVDILVKGHTREELKYMRAFAQYQNKRLSEVANDPFVRSGIEGLRARSKTDAATPAPSSRPAVVASPSGKSFKDMTGDERRANFDQIRSKHMAGGKRSNE